jgi:release factor family 3
MNLLLPADIEPLLEDRPGPCLSFYVPISRPGARTQQGSIRLKNLLRRAGEELRTRKLDDNAVETLLGPAEDLVADSSFWNTQEEGVALFRAPGFMQVFHLPRAFAERCVVADHFFLKPLLPLVADGDTFYVLALSQNETRLLEATCRLVRRLALKNLPHSLIEALGEQKTPQDLTYHTASSAPAGALPAIYHGRGVGAGDKKDELHRYLRQVEVAVRGLLAGRNAPLVLAGAEPLPSIYREISGYPHLASPVIPGNPEHLTDDELGDRAWQLLQPTFDEIRRRAAERFGELAGTGQASSDVREILPAARHGRVEALFLACDADLWGRLDPREKVEVHAAPEEGDEELLDAAALFSLRHGGTVYGLGRGEIPGGGDLAAVFRY